MLKKSLLLMTLFLALLGSARAQSELTVYDGTASSNVVPAYIFYFDDFTRVQHVIPAADLAEMNGKQITSLKYYTTATNVPYTAVSSAKVYLMEVDYTTITALEPIGSGTVVFEGYFDIVSEGSGGALTIEFDTPYAYNGGNLLVGIDNTEDVNYKNINFYGQTVNGASWGGSNGSSLEGVTGSQRNFIPKTTFTYVGSGPICQKPDTFEIVEGSLTSNSVIFNWEGGSGNYNFEYKKSTDEAYQVYPTMSTAFSLESLTPGTTYNARVQSVCSDGVSGYKSLTFMTPFAVPLVEEFNNTSIPTGWTMYTGLLANVLNGSATPTTTTYAWNFNTQNGAFDGDNHAWVNIYGTTCYKWLATPTLLMENNVELMFDMAYTAYDGTMGNPAQTGTDDKFVVLINNNGTWEVLRQWDNADSEYVLNDLTPTPITVNIDLSSYAGHSIAVAFYGESTTSNADNNLHIDNVSIDIISNCRKPSGLAASEIGGHSAKLSWTENGEATEWLVAYAPIDESGNLLDFHYVEADTNTGFVLELDSETTYTVKVRPVCEDGIEKWSNEITFTTDVACPAPGNLTVTDVLATQATISWAGEGESYNLRYKALGEEDFCTVTLYAEDVWQDGTGYQMLLDADANTYGTVIPESGGLTSSGNASAATYAEFEYKIPANADGAMTTTNVIIAQSVSIQIPAGTYDWCITNPTPGDRIWIASSGGTIGGRYDDYVFVAGNTYEFHVYYNSVNDAVDLTITEPGKGAPKADWTEINGVNSPYTLTNLEAETDYVVQVQSNCGTYGLSNDWTATSFTTPSNCEVPSPMDVTEITAHTAILNWSGIQESYQARYRTAGSRELLFFENFDGEPSTWTLVNTVFDRTSSATTDYLAFVGYGYTEAAYLITPELTAFENGGTLEFTHRCYNGSATFQVGFSSTTNDVDAFTFGSEVDAAATMMTAYSVAVPNGTKYIAITATTSSDNNAVLINDFGIYGNEIPAGEWVTATVNATNCPISNLIADTQYEWQVRGVASSCTGGYTDWCEIVTFTTEPSCYAPTNLKVSNITTNTAVLTWESEAESFDISINEGETMIENVTSPYELNLEPGTMYSVKVRSNCGTEGYSDWTTALTFHTKCLAFELPYEYGFDDLLGEGFYDIYCWTYSSFNTANSIGFTYRDQEAGDVMLSFSSYYSADDYRQILVSPEFDTEEAVYVEFEYRASNSNAETFQVGYASTLDLDAFEWDDAISTSGNAWHVYSNVFPAGTKYVAILYQSNYQYYLYVDNFKFEEVVPTTQTTDLVEGWNWISTFVTADDAIDALVNLETSLEDHALQIASAFDGTTEYDDGEWLGDLDEVGIFNGQMYLVYTAEDCSIELEGLPTFPALYEITINPGWNWIGFPSADELEVIVAMANFDALNGDMIASQFDGVIEYDDEWIGEFETFVPGQGYLYYSSSSYEKTLVINTKPIDKSRKAELSNPKPFKDLTKSVNKSDDSAKRKSNDFNLIKKEK